MRKKGSDDDIVGCFHILNFWVFERKIQGFHADLAKFFGLYKWDWIARVSIGHKALNGKLVSGERCR